MKAQSGRENCSSDTSRERPDSSGRSLGGHYPKLKRSGTNAFSRQAGDPREPRCLSRDSQEGPQTSSTSSIFGLSLWVVQYGNMFASERQISTITNSWWLRRADCEIDRHAADFTACWDLFIPPATSLQD